MRKVKYRRATIVCALTAVVALVASCGGSSSKKLPTAAAASTPPDTVRLLLYPGTTLSWVGFIAQQKGYFTKNHLDVSFTTLPAGAQATNALAGGSLDVAMLDPFNTAPLMAQGQHLRLIIGEMKLYWQMVGSKSMAGKSLDDLMPTLNTVGAPSVGGAGGRLAQYLGIVYGRDPKAVSVVADPQGTALLGGHIPALMADPVVACQIEAQGFPLVFSFLNPPAPKSTYPAKLQALLGAQEFGYWAQADWADSHANVVSEMQGAIGEAEAWASNPVNSKEIAALLRGSQFNVPNLNDQQFEQCVTGIAKGFDPHFTEADASLWSNVVTQLGIAPKGLPATTEYFDKGLPR